DLVLDEAHRVRGPGGWPTSGKGHVHRVGRQKPLLRSGLQRGSALVAGLAERAACVVAELPELATVFFVETAEGSLRFPQGRPPTEDRNAHRLQLVERGRVAEGFETACTLTVEDGADLRGVHRSAESSRRLLRARSARDRYLHVERQRVPVDLRPSAPALCL